MAGHDKWYAIGYDTGYRMGYAAAKKDIDMNKRTNVVRIFLTNGTAVDIEVPDDYDCGLAGSRAAKGEPIVGRDHYIAGNMVVTIIRLFAAGQTETVN